MAGDPIPVEKLATVTGLEKSVLIPVWTKWLKTCCMTGDAGFSCARPRASTSWPPNLASSLSWSGSTSRATPPPLSQPAYETLAIIAYNQPVTRAQVEAVRGVNSDSIISRLIERNFVCEVGTLDAPGRPTLFATTEQFLLDFGLVQSASCRPWR
jgi:segregation and condensation protein B